MCILCVGIMFGSSLLAGCQSRTAEGALIGAGAGALTGELISGDASTGAAAGAAGGAAAGHFGR